MRYAVIMAGGAGKRLWPLSRIKRPKQLLPLVAGKSLLELAVERLTGLFKNQNIWIIANTEYAEQIASALPQLPSENIVGEPEGRDTANAIALGAEILRAKDPAATMAVFTADHVIRPIDRFTHAVRTALEMADQHPDALLTFGIRPTWPHTGLGYVHCGEKISDDVHVVLGFKEKPDHHTARRYVENGEYYWNSGMFVWKLGAIRAALDEHLPDSKKKLEAVGDAIEGGRDYASILTDVYPTLEKISIDYAVMEKARKVLLVELGCEWLDVGSWSALPSICEHDDSDNVVVAPSAIAMDSSRNIIVSEDDQLLAVLGVDDCVIVHSPDATLVCNKDDAHRLKDLLQRIEENSGNKHL